MDIYVTYTTGNRFYRCDVNGKKVDAVELEKQLDIYFPICYNLSKLNALKTKLAESNISLDFDNEFDVS